jgi:hypothetical protein
MKLCKKWTFLNEKFTLKKIKLTSEEGIEDIWFNEKEKSIQTNKGPFKSKSR